MDASKYPSQRLAGREHIPLYPKDFIALRIVQLVIGVVILSLDAYGLSTYVFDGDCLNIFTAIATMIVCIYYIVAEFGAPVIYNYWAVLSLDIFLIVFWITSFALMASEVSLYAYLYGDLSTLASCMAAVAGLGGLEFALFVVSLSIHGVMMHRHRAAGLHCNPGAVSGSSTNLTYHTSPQQAQAAAPVHVQYHPQAYSMQIMAPISPQ